MAMRRIRHKPPKHLGEMRTSQLITSYGVGAMVDFRDETGILAEADKWYSPDDSDEERVIRCHSLEKLLEKEFFVAPKWDPRQHAVYQKQRSRDIGAYRFPHMLYCPHCYRLVHDETLAGRQSGELKCPDCKDSRLVPSRFVVVCPHGHLDDFPYEIWVHHGETCPVKKDKYPHLKLKNIEGRNNIGSLQVICEDCNAIRGIQDALTGSGLKSIYRCTGRRPWLSWEYDKRVPCSEDPVTRMRTAAGVYMPVNVSALNIPPWSTRISRVLQKHMTALDGRSDEQATDYIEKNLRRRLPDVSTDTIVAVWKHLAEKDQEERPQNEQHLYEDEYLALCDMADDPDSDFCSLEKPVPTKYGELISKVFAVTRLTEVVAMLGFTRLHRWDGDYRSSALAPIFSKVPEWLPAIELHGEGIFIELSEEAVQQWEQKNAAVYAAMMQNVKENNFRCPNASPRYVLLHTLSHLLIRALAVNCGYQAASMKERIYATYSSKGRAMSGILIYTTAADTEGSLGGLVSQAEPEYLEAYLDALLDEASWCSSDPLCLSSSGKNAQGLFGLNYAACPQCTLLPETSCTMRNSLLDRGALIGRGQDSSSGFFSSVM